MRPVFPQLVATSIVLGTMAPTVTLASGPPDLSEYAIGLVQVLVLHCASLIAALLLLLKCRRWPVFVSVVIAAAALSYAWFLGFLLFASSTLDVMVRVWVWITVPFIVFTVAGARALYQRYLRRAV